MTPLPPVPGTGDTSDNINWCDKENGLWYGLRMCSELGENETEYPTCSIEGFTSETCTNNCYPGAEYCAEKCGNYCNDETPQYDRQCIMYDKYPCEDRNENYSYVSSLCPSTDEIVAEWRKKGYTWEVIRKIYDGNQCHVIVKIPDESGGLCFSIGVSENYEDWMHSTPDETTGFPTTGNYKSSWPRLTRCDATWVLGHDRYRVVINNDDVKIPESGYELLEWNIEQPYFYTGTNTNQYHLSDPVEFENFGQTGENITCKKQQFPNLDTWIKAIEEQNPDYCFLGVGTTPNPSNGAKLFWNTHGAPCVVAPSYTTKPAGQGKNLYEDVYMWWGTRSVGGCSQTYECTDANKPDEYLSFKDYPVCEE